MAPPMKLHRKCNGCRALDFNRGECQLGLEILRVGDVLFKPTCKCTKPDTLEEYFEQLDLIYDRKQAEKSK